MFHKFRECSKYISECATGGVGGDTIPYSSAKTISNAHTYTHTRAPAIGGSGYLCRSWALCNTRGG